MGTIDKHYCDNAGLLSSGCVHGMVKSHRGFDCHAVCRCNNELFRHVLSSTVGTEPEGKHYDAEEKAAPVVNKITINIILVLIVMCVWYSHLVDVKGAFLHGRMDPKHRLFCKVPKGFEKYYPKGVVLRVLKAVYGLIQAANVFWKLLLSIMLKIGLKRNAVDPCLYYQWTEDGLMIVMSWVDDVLMCGPKGVVLGTKDAFMKEIDCDDTGEMKEYIGSKVEHNKEEGWIKLTQPVLLQSFEDEFDLPEAVYETPASPGTVLVECNEDDQVDGGTQSYYRTGVGKLLHVVKKSRSECANAVRELSRWVKGASVAHTKAMHRVMKHMLDTRERGKLIKPNQQWDGKDKNFMFVIEGESDSDHAKDPLTRRSVSGWRTTLCGAPMTEKSKMQASVALSVAEAETMAAVLCVQDMIFIKRVLESLELNVAVPMRLKVDNKAVVDLFNNWTTGGRTRHADLKLKFLRELKEHGLLEIVWQPTENNTADIFTKNVDTNTFSKHASKLVGVDRYMQEKHVNADKGACFMSSCTDNNVGNTMNDSVDMERSIGRHLEEASGIRKVEEVQGDIQAQGEGVMVSGTKEWVDLDISQGDDFSHPSKDMKAHMVVPGWTMMESTNEAEIGEVAQSTQLPKYVSGQSGNEANLTKKCTFGDEKGELVMAVGQLEKGMKDDEMNIP